LSKNRDNFNCHQQQRLTSKAINENKGLLLGAVLGIVLMAGVPEGVLAQSSPVVVAQSGELEEAERLMERVALGSVSLHPTYGKMAEAKKRMRLTDTSFQNFYTKLLIINC